MSTTHDTIPSGYKRCSNGDKCVHPEGPILPVTSEYFGTSGGRMRAQCKRCMCKYAHDRWFSKPEVRERSRELNQRPDVKTKRREYARERRKNPEVTKRQREYDRKRRQDPEKHARELQYLRNRRQNPEFVERQREYQRTPEYKEWLREYNRKRRQDPVFKEQQRLYMREYHKTPKRQQYIRARQQSEEHKEYQERYAQSKRGRANRKIRYHRRRARVLALPDTYTVDDWHFALEYFHGCCAVCGRQLNDLFGERTAAPDHWIPVNSPNCPGTVPDNIVPLCHGKDGCNNSKHDKEPEEWLIWKFGKRKAAKINQCIQAFFATVRRDTT